MERAYCVSQIVRLLLENHRHELSNDLLERYRIHFLLTVTAKQAIEAAAVLHT